MVPFIKVFPSPKTSFLFYFQIASHLLGAGEALAGDVAPVIILVLIFFKVIVCVLADDFAPEYLGFICTLYLAYLP